MLVDVYRAYSVNITAHWNLRTNIIFAISATHVELSNSVVYRIFFRLGSIRLASACGYGLCNVLSNVCLFFFFFFVYVDDRRMYGLFQLSSPIYTRIFFRDANRR